MIMMMIDHDNNSDDDDDVYTAVATVEELFHLYILLALS